MSGPVAVVAGTAGRARSLADLLARAGWRGVPAPVLGIVPEGEGPVDLAGFQAVLVTSPAGAEALGARASPKGATVLAVGGGTARACREAGFARVLDAKGDAGDLCRLAGERLDPGGGPLLHASGRDTARDLAGPLGEAGFRVERRVLYRAEPVRELPAAAREALCRSETECVLFPSARAAEAFVHLARRAGCERNLARLSAACMSRRVADALDARAWRDVRIARRPDAESLVAALPAPAREG